MSIPASLFRHSVIAAALSGALFAQAPTAPSSPATPAPAKPAPPAVPGAIRPVPPPGVAISEGDRSELQAGVTALGKNITVLRASLKEKPELAALLPDVMIFHKAVDWALRYDEIFDAKQVGVAKKLLELGNQRAAELKAGTSSWTKATGLVPRGYISKIDGSVQPYGMLIPEDWKSDEKTGRRLDFWAHGRGEKLSELDFLNQRISQKGEFNPPGTFTLHLYGRYCCANKFAGEVDLFEALESAKKTYNIDPNKLVMRGFSMGGASTWQFGTHFASMWAAVQPGAGFGETKEFMKLGTTADKPLPPAWEQTLWRWYDSTEYVANLSNTTTVAYSGEIDGQKQAADIMIRFAEKEGVKIQHIIGPQTPHKIKPETKPEVDAAVAAGVEKREVSPKKVRFTTYTLIYPKMAWVNVTGLQKQWERADVTAEIQGDKIVATTKNVTALAFSAAPEDGGPAASSVKSVVIDGQTLPAKWNKTTFAVHLTADAKPRWEAGEAATTNGVGKTPVVCGPIDHAFMSSFVNVRPTGTPLNEKVGAWAKAELEHSIGFWRKVYRGDAPTKDDTAITDSDIKNSNLVLWGDPSSNAVLKKIADKLPVKWDAKNLVFAGQTYDATHTAPVLIFPNPLNPAKYVVLNSGVTFREQALLNNADQTAKLPDWAIIDLNTAPGGKWPGEVKAAGFFDEHWKAPTK